MCYLLEAMSSIGCARGSCEGDENYQEGGKKGGGAHSLFLTLTHILLGWTHIYEEATSV